MSSDEEEGKRPFSEKRETHSISSDKNPKGTKTATSSTTASSSIPQSQQSSSPTDKKPAPVVVDDNITHPSTPERPRPRQVIAVSASKGPAAFFNLARKFLVTDDICDLSALEGAIVSAADAAHLLERSKLATIVRVQTSYVVVEPKQRRRNQPQQQQLETSHFNTPGRGRSAPGRDVRRARIVITVQRTESYKRWLEENPLQAVIAGDGDEAHVEDVDVVVGSSG